MMQAAPPPGGPGEDGYTWNGPQHIANAAPAEAEAETAAELVIPADAA